MIRTSPKAAVSLLLSALLLTSCAIDLRPAEPVIPGPDPGEETISDAVPPEGTAIDGMEPENPETEPPETIIPETEKAETEPPETESPETEAPETELTETEKDELEPSAPEPSAPEPPAPEPEPPEPEPPEPETPETEAPETEAPETEAPPPPMPGDGGTTDGDTWRDGELGLRFVLPGDDWRFEEDTDPAGEEQTAGTRYGLRAVSEYGSTVLLMGRLIPEPEDGAERVTLAEYVVILTDGMLESGGEDVAISAGEPGTAELAGAYWIRVEYVLTWPGRAESRSIWYTREKGGWFLTLAVTASPADWLDADGILAMLTSAEAPVPEKPLKPGDPVPPAVFAWGSDSLEENVYRCGFAGLAVTAAEGWRFYTEKELAKRNDLHVPSDADHAAIAEAEDRENARCVMHLENDAGACAELSFIRADVFGEEGWEQYAAYLTESLLEAGEKAGFAMSATDGEWAYMAGEKWFVRIVTYSAAGYPVGQRMLLWRPVEGELAELTLDNGVWTDIPLTNMLAMISSAGDGE